MNRATERLKLFGKPADYAAFLRVSGEALERRPIRVLGYYIMPTHWHSVVLLSVRNAGLRFVRRLVCG